MYFSYGGDMIRLQDNSRHSNDINLHINTQGYSDGEEVEVRLETQNDNLTLKGRVKDNEIIIRNVFRDKKIQTGKVKVYV
ncbi:hypothetical protein CQA53_09665 [Helicobacter didelphidarum]|uniref:Uncharacterized protein n=1 Tax=Helicobacter didelphidarum TaxID=2040648 RepID=A0A3D8IAZ8_9HELI|nr:hypothetical protein CQA53_09665 [Helicobacter didelphidarum]